MFIPMTTGERIKQLREEHGLSQADLAEKLSVSRPTVANWERNHSTPVRFLNELAEVLKVSTDYIMCKSDLRNAESAMHGNHKTIKIPILGRVIAGEPIPPVEDFDEYVDVPPELAASGDFFALRVTGDSMSPEIKPGDIAIIQHTYDCHSGAIALVYIEDEVTLKKVQKQPGGIALIGLNPAVYPPHFYTLQQMKNLQIRIGGILRQVRREY